jgi:predicted enzyme related to lactoylglutathione lyase
MSSDTARSRAFYEALFGWTSEEAGPEYGGYINFLKDGVPVAGCMASQGQDGPDNVWSVYLAVEDAEKTVESAAANGGSVMFGAMDVGTLGRMAAVTDAGGAAIGIWQPRDHQGFKVLAEPGAPGWFELHTRDYDASVRFYRDVFGWDTYVQGDSPEFRYTTLGQDESAQAGIMDASSFLPDGVPAHWSIYFQVESTDAALDQVVKLGGQVVLQAEDTPYGRLATAADATGTLFKFVSNENLSCRLGLRRAARRGSARSPSRRRGGMSRARFRSDAR